METSGLNFLNPMVKVTTPDELLNWWTQNCSATTDAGIRMHFKMPITTVYQLSVRYYI